MLRQEHRLKTTEEENIFSCLYTNAPLFSFTVVVTFEYLKKESSCFLCIASIIKELYL